jgi:hypothetical protein
MPPKGLAYFVPDLTVRQRRAHSSRGTVIQTGTQNAAGNEVWSGALKSITRTAYVQWNRTEQQRTTVLAKLLCLYICSLKDKVVGSGLNAACRSDRSITSTAGSRRRAELQRSQKHGGLCSSQRCGQR